LTEDLDLFGDVARARRAVRLGRRVFLSGPQRTQAQAMRAAGASVLAIAAELGIAEETARRRLKAELERGLPGGRGVGRPRWRPSAEERALVARLAAEGATLGRIGELLGVSAPTLRRHCQVELTPVRRRRANAVREEEA
jgi:predicted transcriptional regulator